MKGITVLFLILMCSFYSFSQKNTLIYDGSSTRIDCSENAVQLGNNFTQEAWVYVENISKNYQLILGSTWMEGSNTRPPSMYIRNTTGLHFGFGDGSGWYAIDLFGDYLSVDAWNHYAVTFDGTTYKCYVNGAEINFDGTFAAGKTPGPYPVRGIGAANTNNYFNGKIDEVRMWDVVLSLEEIRENMNRTLLSPYPAELISYFKFDEGTGSSTTNEINGVPDGAILGMLNWTESDAFNTWKGITDDWNTATNWSQGTIPDSTDNVGIYDEASLDPIVTDLVVDVFNVITGINTTLTVDELSIFNSNTFYSATANVLTIDGDLNIFGILQLAANIDGNGTVFAEDYQLADGVTVYGLVPEDGARVSSHTWNGSFSTNWFDSNNWSKNQAPSKNSPVVIASDPGIINYPIIDGQAALCKDLYVYGQNSSLSIEDGGSLDVSQNSSNFGRIYIGTLSIGEGSVNVDNGTLYSSNDVWLYGAQLNAINGSQLFFAIDVNVLSGSEINLQTESSMTIGQP